MSHLQLLQSRPGRRRIPRSAREMRLYCLNRKLLEKKIEAAKAPKLLLETQLSELNSQQKSRHAKKTTHKKSKKRNSKSRKRTTSAADSGSEEMSDGLCGL